MKRYKISVIAAALLGGFIASSSLATAQDSKPEAKTEKSAPGQQAKRPDRLQQLDKALTLSEEQKGKIKTIFTDEAKQMKAIREEQSGDRKAMSEKLAKLREQTTEKITAQLTPDQKEKYKKMLEEQKQRPQRRQRANQ
jgi:hypothetical protein